MSLLITNAELDGRIVDVRVTDQCIAEIGRSLNAAAGDEQLDANGGALLPGLHDHHLHLHAMAAAMSSVQCGPPEVTDRGTLAAALASADTQLSAGAWLRGIGYHESVAGVLDRTELDRIGPRRPVRIQHRGGAMWVVNSSGLRELGLTGGDPLPAGVETDEAGEPTGRLWRADDLFRRDTQLPSLHEVGNKLLSLGITGITDATPDLDQAAMANLVAARRDGSLPQRLVALGAPDGSTDGLVVVGPRKLLLHDHDLPSLDELTARIEAAHGAGRAVAVHCVTRTSLALTLAALADAGSVDGDRIEHASVVPSDFAPAMRNLRLRVVTQPSFVTDRGDQYRESVAADDLACLYPYASLLAAGVPVAPSSDAPFGDLDPWRTIEAAATRVTAAGTSLGETERVRPGTALDGYFSDPASPGGNPRRITLDAPADLCLLTLPLLAALEKPHADHVRLVIAGPARYDAV